MSNIEILDEIINGAKKTIDYQIEGVEKPFKLRLLTTGELTELQRIENDGQKAKMNIETKGKTREEIQEETREQVQKFEQNVDLGSLKSKTNKVMYTAVAWSLSDSTDPSEKVQPEKIKSLPAGLPQKIFRKIVEINDLTKDDLNIIANFRKE